MRRWLGLALVVVGLSGCYKLDIDATALEPHVYMSGPATVRGGAGQNVGSLDAKTTGSWALWGLLPLKEPDVDGLIQRELARSSGTAVHGLSIRTQQTFVDGLLSAITFGLYGQRTVFVEGTVVR